MDCDDKVILLLGEVRGEVRGMRGQMDRLETHVEVVRQGFEEQGKAIGELQVTDRVRRKQISDLYASVGKVREDTGRVLLANLEHTAVRRWWARVGRAVWATRAFWLPPLLMAVACAVGLAAVR